MSVLLLDSGPLGLVTHPRGPADAVACKEWLRRMVSAGARVMIPEIADYEVRRELLRGRKHRGIQQLEALIRTTEFLALTTPAMRRAAEFWADARQTGQQTAADERLDADVILAAQAATLELPDVVATSNLRHLGRFCGAMLWSDISPS